MGTWTLIRAIDLFLAAKAAEGISPKTATWYSMILARVGRAFESDQGVDVLTAPALRAWIVGLQTMLAPVSISGYVRTLKGQWMFRPEISAMTADLRSALVLDDQGAFGDCLRNEPLRDQLGFPTELEEPRIRRPEGFLLVLDRGKAIRVRLDRLRRRPHVLFEIVHRSPLLPIVTWDPVAVTVHVPHSPPLARQITRPHDCPRILASENLLELGDRLPFSEGGFSVIAEGDVVGRVGDEGWPLGLGH